ncbi:MAG: hypothetical protein JWN62_2562 [Acidimicrobiales bacterium]|nr:hypothetical protein [Acidimicrobiales bacterium]
MNPSKRKMYAVLAGVGISLGAAGIASAASTPSSAPSVAAVTAATTVDTTPATPATTATSAATADTGTGTDQTAPSYTSSVTIPVAADGSKPTDAELHAVATVSSDAATAAALASTPGTAGTAELKSVGGNVVWEVDVTATAGGDFDVIVDAGNATVLATHAEGGHGGGHGDATPSYTSSVTVAVPTDGSKATDAELQAVATVSSDQAIAAALANTPGTAGTAALKSVAGNVVWDVDVTATAGGSYDVIVDAGNSTILASHVEGGHGGGHHGHHNDDATDATDTPASATTTG